MTITGINKFLKPLVASKMLFYFSTTSAKSVYASHASDIIFDDETEVISWTDSNNFLKYHVDYQDINMVVEATPDSKIGQNMY